MRYEIAVIPGDGIGPDVVREALGVLDAVGARFGREFRFTSQLMGGAAIDAEGVPLPASTLAACRESHAVLLGAVGGPKWDALPGSKRPEAGLLGIRSGLGVFANLRPAVMFPELASACPLRPDIAAGGLDILIVRELTGGIYFGERGRSSDGLSAWDTERYSRSEIERLLEVAFEAARDRNKKLCVVDKANILESSRLWREVAASVAPNFPSVELSYMYVDNCAMQLVRNPRQFDVIATSNMFGDILSDEASMLTGSIGMLASASLGEGGPGLYEPIHGSAPDIAGQDKANPLATVLSAAMLLRYSLHLEDEAKTVEKAVASVLAKGLRCADITSGAASERVLGTRAMGQAVVDEIKGAKS
ncbi:MAG TPA: 3-isopropylmalate dehydrogenase [Rectinemataceae bacterium]|nr:3-isopropylmalate dehydrogenase [Rectinemataceae bacterium]